MKALLKIAKERFVHSSFNEGKGKDVMRRYDIHHKGKNIAYASISPTSTEGDGPWISGVYVSPKYRGQGLSRKLINRIAEEHPNKNLRLRARPYKDKAVPTKDLVSIYRKMGFKSYDRKNRMVMES